MNIPKPPVGICLAFLLLVLPMSSGAEIVFDNLPVGPPPLVFSPNMVEAASYQPAPQLARRTAAKFTVTRASYALESVMLPISYWGGSRNLRVSLAADVDGAPGTVLRLLAPQPNPAVVVR